MDFSKLNYLEELPPKWDGSVLCLLLSENSEQKLFFIKRSEDVPSHKGQIAFIGGHRHDGEDHPFKTCLREFEEETHLDANDLELLGILPTTNSAYDFKILPVVGKYNKPIDHFISKIKTNGEWEISFAVDVEKLLLTESWSHGVRIGVESNNSILIRSITEDEVTMIRGDKDHFVLWGATARIVWNFLALIHR